MDIPKGDLQVMMFTEMQELLSGHETAGSGARAHDASFRSVEDVVMDGGSGGGGGLTSPFAGGAAEMRAEGKDDGEGKYMDEDGMETARDYAEEDRR